VKRFTEWLVYVLSQGMSTAALTQSDMKKFTKGKAM